MTDMKILKDLSTGETDMTKLGELIGNHGALLKHAMKCKCGEIESIIGFRCRHRNPNPRVNR